MRASLKGGLIGLIFILFITLFVILTSSEMKYPLMKGGLFESKLLFLFSPGLILYGIIFCSGADWCFPEMILSFFLNFVFYFFIGAIIGLVISKIKKRKKKNKNGKTKTK